MERAIVKAIIATYEWTARSKIAKKWYMAKTKTKSVSFFLGEEELAVLNQLKTAFPGASQSWLIRRCIVLGAQMLIEERIRELEATAVELAA